MNQILGVGMQAHREFVKVNNHRVQIQLPDSFNYEEVEVIVMPRDNSADLSHLAQYILEGQNSPDSELSHQQLFEQLKAKYED